MMKNYIKIAFKVMLRKKYYTALSLIGISFTIMMVTVFASFIDSVIGANATEVNRNRTLIFDKVSMYKAGKETASAPSYPFIEKYVAGLESTEYVSAFTDISYVSDVNGRLQGHHLKLTDENFWKIMTFDFLEGKPFHQTEVKTGARVAVITEKAKEYFFNDQQAVGKSIAVYGNSYKVIGVVEPAVGYSKAYADIYLPLTTDTSVYSKPNEISGSYCAMLLAKTSDLKKVRTELRGRMRKIRNHVSGVDSVKAYAFTALEQFSKSSSFRDDEPEYGKTAIALIVVLILFMLIPAISLINLNLSRIGERAEEIGIRKSFGATSRAVINQLVIENIIITLVGGLVGLGLAIYASQLLVVVINSFDPLFKIPEGSLILSWRVFASSLFSCLLFGLLSGVYPAWKISRLNVIKALRGGNNL
ncbi:ABC transporter permease [Paradesertivirga mongoliensis]|uniref:ABC transporter permease n=1 Tax=Paradesertivirga mongoliensis TaxID=2100740 RepID=A0ABW4ZH79_9SPHI|nr:ABC transporter permease [Pedobacter mongoliensis]